MVAHISARFIGNRIHKPMFAEWAVHTSRSPSLIFSSITSFRSSRSSGSDSLSSCGEEDDDPVAVSEPYFPAGSGWEEDDDAVPVQDPYYPVGSSWFYSGGEEDDDAVPVQSNTTRLKSMLKISSPTTLTSTAPPPTPLPARCTMQRHLWSKKSLYLPNRYT
jgi:hypothetical protein